MLFPALAQGTYCRVNSQYSFVRSAQRDGALWQTKHRFDTAADTAYARIRAAIRRASEAATQAVKAHVEDRDQKPHPEQRHVSFPSAEKGNAKIPAPVPPQPQLPKLPLAERQLEFAMAKQTVAASTVHPYDLKPHPTRKFIEVPFEAKDEAKWRGAKWDLSFKKWYVPTGMNRNLFHWPDALSPPAMRAVEFPPDEPSTPRKKGRRKKKASSSSKSTVANKLLQKEINGRLQFLLDKPD